MLQKLKLTAVLFLVSVMLMTGSNTFAHCDSFDGPVILDAKTALETNNIGLVLKWVASEQEQEITALFSKTYDLRNGDQEIYAIVERFFLETLVRLHRETEGAPYTGLKPEGTTKKIIRLSDQAIENEDIDHLLGLLNHHLGQVLREKYNEVAALSKVKNESVEKGREYVAAYVNYTHTIEAIHDMLEHGNGGHAGH
jgi:hypothetical protein